ncbi:hypothetical protein BC1002_6994 (plasmid) [Paraburkholderia atlantica]|uniref:Uncharacterized protein n=1 Tax=Paraburkholderia atlantica TaxID=2654982 RepID=D5WN99_PARAM|nr:hypothetical protein BC1002_6994 [Paraburkholderia atlantica]
MTIHLLVVESNQESRNVLRSHVQQHNIVYLPKRTMSCHGRGPQSDGTLRHASRDIVCD